MVNRSPVLQALPRYAFAGARAVALPHSQEAQATHSSSTIEALMHVLGVLEGDPARVRALLDPFHAMVDAQLAAQATAPRRSSAIAGRAKIRAKPVARAEATRGAVGGEHRVQSHGRSNAWPSKTARPGGELVQVALHRPATGATFAAIVAPAGELAPSTAFYRARRGHAARRSRTRRRARRARGVSPERSDLRVGALLDRSRRYAAGRPARPACGRAAFEQRKAPGTSRRSRLTQEECGHAGRPNVVVPGSARHTTLCQSARCPLSRRPASPCSPCRSSARRVSRPSDRTSPPRRPRSRCTRARPCR